MIKLTLEFKDKILQEYNFSGDILRIGRNPDNDIVVTNVAVSKHHAQIRLTDGQYILTDLDSTNGTYVNVRRVKELELRDKDKITIGKHVITVKLDKSLSGNDLFADVGNATMVLDTRKQKELLSDQPIHPVSLVTSKPSKLIVFQSGKRKVYELTKEVTLIGKSKTCDIVLNGLLMPQVAATITKENDAYYISSYGGWINVNVNNKLAGNNFRLFKNNVIQIRNVKIIFQP